MTEDKEYDTGKRKIVLVGLGQKAGHYNYYSENIFCRSEKERIHSMYNKTIIRFSFCDIHNNKGLGKGYQITPTSTLIILDIT